MVMFHSSTNNCHVLLLVVAYALDRKGFATIANLFLRQYQKMNHRSVQRIDGGSLFFVFHTQMCLIECLKIRQLYTPLDARITVLTGDVLLISWCAKNSVYGSVFEDV